MAGFFMLAVKELATPVNAASIHLNNPEKHLA